jgi:hypothetical protein
MLQFRRRRIPILTCVLDHDHNLCTCHHDMREVIEVVGTGLAIQPNYCETNGQDAYSLVHMASATILTRDTAPTIVTAVLWLRRLLPLFDWTLPHEAVKPRRDLADQVHWAVIEALHENKQREGQSMTGNDRRQPLVEESVSLLYELDLGRHTLCLMSDGSIELLANQEQTPDFAETGLHLDSVETYRLFISLHEQLKQQDTYRGDERTSELTDSSSLAKK